ncbi:CBS domain-containing protein, partial [[Eubacterium] cellulosolvens]
MTKKVVMCNPSNSIMDVRELMRKHRINRIIVVVGENKPL